MYLGKKAKAAIRNGLCSLFVVGVERLISTATAGVLGFGLHRGVVGLLEKYVEILASFR